MNTMLVVYGSLSILPRAPPELNKKKGSDLLPAYGAPVAQLYRAPVYRTGLLWVRVPPGASN
jgi:hypothetical protein